MSTIELKAVETVLPVVRFNYDEIKATVVGLTEQYKGLIVTEETLKSSKSTQRELASLRNQIDTYRKDKKREIKKPIDAFEDKCKELIGVVLEVENPIKKGLIVFEEKRKKNQQLWVNDIVKEMIEKYKLGEEYADRIITEERFLNATISEQEVVDNIESQAKLLNAGQEGEKEKIQTIKTFLKTTNDNLKLISPIPFSELRFWIDGVQVINLPAVLEQIKWKGESRKESETKAQEVKVEEPEGEVVVEKPEMAKFIDGKFIEEPIMSYRIDLKCKRSQLDELIITMKESNLEIVGIKHARL